VSDVTVVMNYYVLEIEAVCYECQRHFRSWLRDSNWIT